MCEPVIGQEIPASNDSLAIGSQQKDGWLSTDKAAHFAVSAFITAGSFYVLHQEQGFERDKSLLLSAGLALAFGIGKEIYDRRNSKQGASWNDLAADVVGIGVAVISLRQ